MKKGILSLLVIAACLPLLSFDTWWHAECTRKAMTGNGFSSDARLATQVSNYLTDFFPAYHVLNEKIHEHKLDALRVNEDASFEYMHFDCLYTTADIDRNWKTLLNNTIYTLRKYSADGITKPGYRLPVLFNIIGASLHTVQDFYSHSNWVNLYMAAGTSPIPIWFDVDSAARSKMKLVTGAYPDGSAKGQKNHGDLNKDCSTRQYNKEAVETAERASIDWVKRLMDSVPTAPWGELKAYNIQKDMVLKRFLVNLDATFLTSSSICLDHFDGLKPAKYVFSATKELPKERAQALIALNATVAQYFGNVAVKENTFQLPTPYWAGFKAYHITRDIANGLMLAGKKYSR
jgi:hypothetical protein